MKEKEGYTIFIPVYNEEEIIYDNTKKLSKFLEKLKVTYEIIIVSNGSTDNTVTIGKKLEKEIPNLRFFSLKERGVGLAIKKGIKEAKYPHFLTVDMDLSIDLNFLKNAIDLLKRNDIVIGSKQMGHQKRSSLRKIPSSVFTFLTRTLLKLPYADYSIAAKAYKKEVLKKFIEEIDQGSSYVINIVYYAQRSGKRIVEVPVECDDRRKSKFNLMNEIVYRFLRLVGLYIRRNKYRT